MRDDGGSRYHCHSWRETLIGGEQRVVAPSKELALEAGPSLFREKNRYFYGGVDILSKFEIERRLADALYEINYASKILNGEVTRSDIK